MSSRCRCQSWLEPQQPLALSQDPLVWPLYFGTRSYSDKDDDEDLQKHASNCYLNKSVTNLYNQSIHGTE